MKTIRWKFMSVFLVATAATMAVVLGLFNIAIRFYFERNARAELKGVFTTMNVLIEKQLMRSVVGGDGREALLDLSAALTASKLAGEISFFIFDEDLNLVFPDKSPGTTLSPAVMEKIRSYGFSGDIEKVSSGKMSFLVAGMPFDKLDSGRLYIVFVAGMSAKSKVISALNLLLAGAMAVSLAAGSLYAAASARSLVQPIKNVCRYAGEIGRGRFTAIPPDSSSLETSELIRSINEMSEMLRAADHAQKLFLQNASHELRTPLMSIQGYAEAIEKGIGYDPKEAAKIIKSESIRLTTLVEQLITLSKFDSNIYSRDFSEIDLSEAVAESLERARGLALREGKEIKADLKAGYTVMGDDYLLANIFDNVLSNCIRYAKSAVAVSLGAANSEAVVTVSDDGGGFDEEDLKHVFERFYKGKGGKFGLGLAIAQKASELLGGSIEAKNGASGAVFIVHLPLARK